MKNKNKNFNVKVFSCLLVFNYTMSPAESSCNCDTFEANKPVSIFHAFNMTFQDIIKRLPELKSTGYSHIQISPAQKSRVYNPGEFDQQTPTIDGDIIQPGDDLKAWWLRYQPEGYEIGNVYGTRDDLKMLLNEAEKNELLVIADVVFNHMASIYNEKGFTPIPDAIQQNDRGNQVPLNTDMDILEAHYAKEGFNASDFKQQATYDDSTQEKTQNTWLFSELPDLKTENPKVIESQIRHLKDLSSLGVSGARFDAAKNINPASIQRYADLFPKLGWWGYGECLTTDPYILSLYQKFMPQEDFTFVKTMKNAFSFGGSLSELKVPKTNSDPRSVTFSINHDIYTGGISGFIFPARYDGILANLFLLARKDGVPLIFREDHNRYPEVRTGVLFRSMMAKLKAPMEWVLNSREVFKKTAQTNQYLDQNVLVMERGQQGVLFLNKGEDEISEPSAVVKNLQGTYQCLNYDYNKLRYSVSQKGNEKVLTNISEDVVLREKGIFIPPRQGLFFCSRKSTTVCLC